LKDATEEIIIYWY